MRIGIVLPAPPGYSETFFLSKINGLISGGHDVILFAGKKEGHFDHCPVFYSPKSYKFPPVKVAGIFLKIASLAVTKPSRILKFYKLEKSSGRSFRQIIENIYINGHIINQQLDWLHFGYATMALRRENVAQAIGAKMGVSLRGYDISLYPLKNPGCYNLLWEKVSKVHVISNALAEKAYQFGMNRKTPVMKITPAINVQNFKRHQHTSNPVKPIKILTIARLKWVKGLEYTIEALAMLKNQGIKFHYTIIGEGEEFRRLVFAASQTGISDNITFAGKLSHQHVKQAMESTDIYIQYSLQEGFCNSVLEAQAMELLCVVSDAEGLPENVVDKQTGWVVPRRNSKMLARQILNVIQTPESELNSFRSNASDRVAKEFNLERQQNKFNVFFCDNTVNPKFKCTNHK